MMARAILVACLLVLLGTAATAPTAAAAPSCVVGSSEPNCLVSVQQRVCVTDPCDELDVCVGYGRICPV